MLYIFITSCLKRCNRICKLSRSISCIPSFQVMQIISKLTRTIKAEADFVWEIKMQNRTCWKEHLAYLFVKNSSFVKMRVFRQCAGRIRINYFPEYLEHLIEVPVILADNISVSSGNLKISWWNSKRSFDTCLTRLRTQKLSPLTSDLW